MPKLDSQIKKDTASNVVVNVVATVIATGILAGLGWLASQFPSVFTNIWRYITAPMSISRWIVWLAAGYISFSLLRGLLRWVRSVLSVPAEDWNYVEDTFDGLLWRWGPPPHGLHHLASFCPTCNTRLVVERILYFKGTLNPGTSFFCETCNRELAQLPGNLGDVKDRVGRQIERKVREQQQIRETPDNQ